MATVAVAPSHPHARAPSPCTSDVDSAALDTSTASDSSAEGYAPTNDMMVSSSDGDSATPSSAIDSPAAPAAPAAAFTPSPHSAPSEAAPSVPKFCYTNKLPFIDGHFWVVRDSAIVDPFFGHPRFRAKDRRYVEAPPLVQKVFISMHTTQFDANHGALLVRGWTPRAGNAILNAIVDQRRNGGELRFGSMGYRVRGTAQTVWEYGHGDYKTVKDFLNQA